MKIRQLIKQSGSTGVLLWLWPLLQLVLTRQRSVDEFMQLDRNAYVIMAFVILCSFVVVVSSLRRRTSIFYPLNHRPLLWMFLYTLLCGISAFWSASPLYTGWRAFEAIVFLLLIASVLQRFREKPELAVEWIVFWSVWAGLMAGCTGFIAKNNHESLIEYIPETGAGIYVLVLLFAMFILNKKKLTLALLMFCVISTSTKVYIGIIIGIGLYSVLSRSTKWQKIALMSFLGLLLVIISCGPMSVVKTLCYGKSENNIRTGTGRTVVWTDLIQQGMNSPLLGKGFVMGERVAVTEGRMEIYLAHNAFLAAFMGTGIVGAILIILFFADMFRFSMKQQEFLSWRPVLIGTCGVIFTIAMFSNIIGSRINTGWSNAMFIAGIISILGENKYN